jgi:hypothetical protein
MSDSERSKRSSPRRLLARAASGCWGRSEMNFCRATSESAKNLLRSSGTREADPACCRVWPALEVEHLADFGCEIGVRGLFVEVFKGSVEIAAFAEAVDERERR